MSLPNAPVSGSVAAQTTGARLVVDALLTHGVERVFCVPGESFLAVLDSLHDETERIQTVVCRHEAAAANMAEAVGKLTAARVLRSSRGGRARRMHRSACIPRFRTPRR